MPMQFCMSCRKLIVRCDSCENKPWYSSDYKKRDYLFAYSWRETLSISVQ